MLCLTLLLIFMKITCISNSNVGTTIFYNRRAKAECWSGEDVAKLRARKMFQETMPVDVAPNEVNSRFIKNALRFYRHAMRTAYANSDSRTSAILTQALADTIGGHLRYQMLPTARFAYYAGYVPYRHVRKLHDFLDSTKTYLNTKGIGWKAPQRVSQWSNLTVVKVLIGSGKLFDPCACLVAKRDSNSCIHLPTPKLDDVREPSAIALPFKVGGLVSLTSARSENILLKYYTTAARCILRSSPEKCRHSDFVNFNNELWHWMKRDVAPHLLDEKLYVAYGGVLRIAAAVQTYGKGLSRRNLFEYQDSGVSKWHPWQALTQSYVYINADWTPKLYVAMVLLAAVAICLLQVCYNYMFGDGSGCRCRGPSKSLESKKAAFAAVDTTPPMLQTRNGEKNRHKHPSSRSKSPVGSVKTQRVYDLNENAEKLMEVILSGNEGSGESEIASPNVTKQEDSDVDNVINLAQSKMQKSPPKLQTPIAQLRIEKPRLEKSSLRVYSTCTGTHSDVTFCQEQASESAWSGTGSTTSEHSVSTDSSKTPSRMSRNSRDLAWARRVVSKHTQQSHTQSTTGTEFDINSYMTPPSKR